MSVGSWGITPNSNYCSNKESGGLDVDHARRLKELERENARLKKVVTVQLESSIYNSYSTHSKSYDNLTPDVPPKNPRRIAARRDTLLGSPRLS
jgi:hypothetical protein